MNNVIMIGNLTKDPVYSTTSNNIGYCRFSIAVSRDYKNKEGHKDSDFFNCTAWRTLAENIVKYCKKGSKVCVNGVLQNRTYEDSKGNKHTMTEILAESVEFLSMASKNEAEDIEDGLETVDDGELPF